MSAPVAGFMVIADITGYTAYLNEAELDHAQGVLESLLGLLVEGARSPLVVSNLAGDAVFSYALDASAIDGQTVVDIVEATYIAFRRAIDLMVLNTTCACNACVNISALDLKVFVHHGTFTMHRVAGREELLGPDVITIHRLLKNQVRESTGIAAYALFTQQAVEALNLPGFADDLIERVEAIEGQRPVTVYIRDLHPVWMERSRTERLEIPDRQVLVRESGEIAAPPAVVWDYVIRPEYRASFLQVERQDVEERRGGRVGEGTVYRCYHGKGEPTTQTVIDWHPLEQLATRDTTPVPKTNVVMVSTLDQVPGGTRLTVTCARATGPWAARTMCNIVGKFVMRSTIKKGLAMLAETARHEVDNQLRSIPDPAGFSTDAVARAASEGLRGSKR